jgi:hypothetical protein
MKPAAKKRVPVKKKPAAKKLLTPQQESFCRYYVENSETRGNATESYGYAYDYKLDELPDDDGIYQGVGKLRKCIQKSTRRKAYDVCSVHGNRLVRSSKIQDRITKLYNELLRDDIVDRELSKVIMQDQERAPKIAAIREFNKLKQRITDKVDLTTKGESLAAVNETQLERIARRLLNGGAPVAA